MKKVLLQCSGVLLIAHFILFWLLNNPFVDVPRYIPISGLRQINLYGLTVFLAMGFIIWRYLKKFEWEDPEVSLFELASIGLLAELCAEAIFQLVRQFSFPDSPDERHAVAYLVSVAGMTLMAGIISLYIAGRLKRNRIIPVVCVMLWIGLGLVWQHFHLSSLV